MWTFEEALAAIEKRARRVAPELSDPAPAQGRVLDQEVVAGADLPPFDTTAMDGWALTAEDLAGGRDAFEIVGVLAAGGRTAGRLEPGRALKVMTGAPLPEGASAVVPVEDATVEGSTVRIPKLPAPGTHVRKRGEVFAKGTTLLRPGRRLSPADIGLAAAAGYSALAVSRRPRARLLVTGDEVVEAGRPLGPGQIWNSNGPLLAAALSAAGADVNDMGVVADKTVFTRTAIQTALDADVELVVLSGGVSAGDFDLVRPVLEELGAEIVFHKVAIRPAKPVLFAVCGRVLVFGLPGNPVSVAVAFDLLVRPALRLMTGQRPALPTSVEVVLDGTVSNKGPRLAFHPARVRAAEGALRATPLAPRGSHDVLAQAAAEAYLVLPGGSVFQPGDRVPAYLASPETTLGSDS